MAGQDHPRRAILDGALPLAALLAVTLLFAPLRPGAYALASLYLVFAAGMASGGAERPGEPDLPWRLYALSAGVLAIEVPLIGLEPGLKQLLALPLALFGTAFLLHLRARLRHGVCRVGILSACGRRAHDARIGRTIEAALLALVLATIGAGPAAAGLFAVVGWLLTAAAVAERPSSETAHPPGLPSGAGPVPAA